MVISVPDALEAVDVATRIAAGVRDAYATTDEPRTPREYASPYRPVLDDTQAPEPVDARLAEVTLALAH